MKTKKHISILAIIFLFGIDSLAQSNHKTIQDNNFWIVLDVKNESLNADYSVWDIQVNRIGNYDVQIIQTGNQISALPKINLETQGNILNEIPKQIFEKEVNGQKQVIYQFSKPINFNADGLVSFKISNPKSISQVRIIPTHRGKLGFGTDKYLSEWNLMHNSPEKQAALSWFKEAKYGMFIHWGLYSASGGIWKGTKMEDSKFIGPNVSEWLMFKFQIPRDEYADLAQSFNPDKSFAQNIAKLAKDAGMKYVVITTKHHDGFAMFDSKISEFDIIDATPYKADAVKELYDACLAEGLDFGVYYSHGNDWHDGSDGNYFNEKKKNDSLGILSHPLGKNLWNPSPNTHADYIENKALPQIKELLQSMPKLRLIWFDGEGYITEAQSFEFYKTVYDINPKVIVNRRIGYDFGDYLDAGDNVIPKKNEKMSKYFETVGTTNNSWAYKSYDNDFKSTKEILYYLVDIASKGGNYLLNIGPDGKGLVPEQSAKTLREIGQWLKINGEAIYNTNRWIIPNEALVETVLEGTAQREKKGFSSSLSEKDFWFTSKENKVFVFSFANPKSLVKIKSLKLTNGKVEKVSLLGSSAKLKWTQNKDNLMVDLQGIPLDINGYVLEVVLKK